MAYNDTWEKIAVLIGMIIVCAMIVAVVYIIGWFMNQGAIRENKLATECMQAGGTWKHGGSRTGSLCVWGKEPG